MIRVAATQWLCIGLAVVWLILSWVATAPDASVVISSVFLAAAFVIGAVRP
jgi:hypothetical protein